MRLGVASWPTWKTVPFRPGSLSGKRNGNVSNDCLKAACGQLNCLLGCLQHCLLRLDALAGWCRDADFVRETCGKGLNLMLDSMPLQRPRALLLGCFSRHPRHGLSSARAAHRAPGATRAGSLPGRPAPGSLQGHLCYAARLVRAKTRFILRPVSGQAEDFFSLFHVMLADFESVDAFLVFPDSSCADLGVTSYGQTHEERHMLRCSAASGL